MFEYFKNLVSEFFGIYSSIFNDDASDEISEEVKQFVSLVVAKKYDEAGHYFVDAVKDAKDVDIDDMALHADNVGLDLKEMVKVIDAIRSEFTPETKTAYDPEHKAVSILQGVLTYAHS
jgi:hypothetical protein